MLSYELDELRDSSNRGSNGVLQDADFAYNYVQGYGQ